MAETKGECDPRFQEVQKHLKDFLDSGEENGASIVINVDGKNVVDIWGGYADTARTIPWERDTIVNVWSSSKTVCALAALILIDRGLLDPYEKVTKYWPEFAQNGKENVEVRHFLSHTSGVSGWEREFSYEQYYELESATAALAKQAPWWEPGTATGYHALNMGHLIGELVRRTTGKSLTQFIAEEIAEPLGADFQLGAKESDWDRVAEVIPPPPLPLPQGEVDMESIMMKTFANPFLDALQCLTPEWRKAELGATNGHANARALARIMSVIALGGEVDGVRLLSPKTIDLIFDKQSSGLEPDKVAGVPFEFGIGYAIGKASLPPGMPDSRFTTWGGWGGSVVIADLDNRVTMSYVMNKMGEGIVGSKRTYAYVQSTFDVFRK